MNRLVRWTRAGAGVLLGLLILVLGVVYGLSEYRIRKSYHVQPGVVALRGDSATLARGQHIAITRGCVDCHSGNFAGRVFIDAPPVVRLFASNLTSGAGGVGSTYRDEDWVRAIRHGVGPDGKPLLFMPSQEFNVLSDQDLGALIAYLKSLPPVNNAPVPNRVGPVGRLLFLKGDVPLLPAELIDHTAPRPAPPIAGATAEYGAYLSTGCTGCHGLNFAGGKVPGTPPSFPIAANLTPHRDSGIGSWTERDFFTALRHGRRPDGRQLAPEMPWKLTAQMTDAEIRAIWLHLRTLPAREHGER